MPLAQLEHLACTAQQAQELFDKTYITASEMMRYLNISRAGFLYGRRAGKVPEPICLNDGRLFVWERAKVKDQLEIWKNAVTARKLS